MLSMNTETYYRLLNWGLKLAGGAGSACGVKQGPVGHNRAYVQVDKDADMDRFYETWKTGRNFVTNGPMIFLKTKDGHGPGDEIHLDSPGATINVQVKVLSDPCLQQVDIVQNGLVIKQMQGRDAREFDHRFALPIQQSCWLAARCTARDDHLPDKVLQAYNVGPNLRSSRLRFAHTSPVYVTVGNQPVYVKESVREGLKMLDQLEAYGKQTAAPKYLGAFLTAVREARDILKNRMNP